ncbi:MAG TPA: aminoglycoside phosphotransferase family protein [Galbitalea sp.]|jgi:aminoglycoside phosphotransferase (APT) family kinase protein|nr:aminoglycoside phosphotransferase family protein [Galbitalea sp.]
MDTPAAEVDIDEALVRKLLRQQHPDLANLPLTLVANGWDNAILRLGSDLTVRLPRRAVAAVLVENEQRWLPEVASRVSVAVPEPVRIGMPGDLFPWHWTVARWFEGELASKAPPTSLHDTAFALAGFVRELHTPAPTDAPFNPVRGIPLAVRAETIEARLVSGLVPDASTLAALWQRALSAPVWTGGPIWLHGDLHAANILVRDGELAAVLDFGDICSGDPATDLATAWLTFDADGRGRFRAALNYDDATWLRAAGWAILLGTALVTNSSDNPAMHRLGTRTLEQVLLE